MQMKCMKCMKFFVFLNLFIIIFVLAKASWLYFGSSIEQIYRNLPIFTIDHLEPIGFNQYHSVLYKHSQKTNDIWPKSIDERFKKNRWSNNYVRLPTSSDSFIHTKQIGGATINENLWEKVNESLFNKEFGSSYELEEAISSYNNRINKLTSLHSYFNQLDKEERIYFLKVLIPNIINLALKLPELIKCNVPLLKQGQNYSVSLSQEQVSCLLANAFFCTFPYRGLEYPDFPGINFNRLFEAEGQTVVEKIKCILNYFDRVTQETPSGVLTFTRRSNENFPDWSKLHLLLSDVPFHVTSEGSIEEHGIDLLQVDFANKYIGGGVLGRGSVQEEIRFVICPELIISRLFTERLNDDEALIMSGAEQYSKYSGYAKSFQFNGDYKDLTPYDSINNRRRCHIVGIDATYFANPNLQYTEYYLKRELNKAYAGFFDPYNKLPPGVASGNWGCGAFRGDPKLKALIQLMACAVTNRPLLYFTFGDKNLKGELLQIYMFFQNNNIKISQLWNYIKYYASKKKFDENLYEFIYRIHNEKTSYLAIFYSVKSKILDNKTKFFGATCSVLLITTAIYFLTKHTM